MTSKQHEDRPENPLKGPAGAGAFTRADLKAEEKPTEPAKAVTLTSPSGATVTTSEENVETLKDAGYT